MPVSIRWPVTVTVAECAAGLTAPNGRAEGCRRRRLPDRVRDRGRRPLRGPPRGRLRPRPGLVPAAARSEPSFLPNDTEAVWELAENRYVFIEVRPEHAGHAMHTIFVGDFDDRVQAITDRGDRAGRAGDLLQRRPEGDLPGPGRQRDRLRRGSGPSDRRRSARRRGLRRPAPSSPSSSDRLAHPRDQHRHAAAGDRRDPQDQADVGGQPQQAGRADEDDARDDEQHRVERGGGGRGQRRRRRRLEVLVRPVEDRRLVRRRGGPSAGSSSPTGRPCSASKADTIRAHSASSSISRSIRADGGRPGQRGRGLVARVGQLRGVLVDDHAGLRPAGAVDEQPVRRRAGEEHRAGVLAHVGRRLEVGGDARPPAARRAGARPPAGRRRAAGSRGWRPARCRGAAAPARGHRDSAGGVSAAAACPEPRPARGSSPPSPRRSPGRRCRGWPRGSCRAARPR